MPELGISVTWPSPAHVAPVPVAAVDPWSAELPRLYDAQVAAHGETVSLRLGFRTVQIVGDQFLVNGRRVVFHGMNRHETHPDRGRVFDEAAARADLQLMKRFNVNAIRTSHYPPHPRLLDLADELGFWVVLECDLETHGFEAQGWVQNPSDDPQWREAYLDRIERTIERDKNHASIVMWSLGNEAGTGQNLAAMAAWAHRRDASRPVHYEGDYTGEYTDVYARMYSSVPETDAIGRDDSTLLLLGCSAAESARQRSKPFILCEYAHAMGNGPGAIEQYEDLVDRYPRLHGAFVWEWRDHGMRTRTADGTEYFGYGGDFGEVVHDGNFVMDGMVLSDSTPTPGLWEYKQVVAPLRLRFGAQAGVAAGAGSAVGAGAAAGERMLTVSNLRHSAAADDVAFLWRAEVDGHPLRSGELVVAGADGGALRAGESALVAVPAEAWAASSDAQAADSGEVWLTVEAVLRAECDWAPAGHVISTAQVQLGSRGAGAVPGARPAASAARALMHDGVAEGTPGALTLGAAEFVDGRLVALAGRPVSGPRLELWRAPTDNDRGTGRGVYDLGDPWAGSGNGVPGPALADTWREAGLHRLTARVEAVSSTAQSVRVRTRYAPANSAHAVVVDEVWQLVAGELVLQLDLVPTAGWNMVWPRVGVRFDVPNAVDRAAWFGTGPRESYPDSTRAAWVGRYAAAVEELSVPYGRPQESGHRSDLRSLQLSAGDDGWLLIEADADAAGRRPGFTVARHTAQQLGGVGHAHELTQNECSYLYIDAAQHGLGSRACGPDVWPDFALRPQARSLTLRIAAA